MKIVKFTELDNIDKDKDTRINLCEVIFYKVAQRKILNYTNIIHIFYIIPELFLCEKSIYEEKLNYWIEQIDIDVLFMPSILGIQLCIYNGYNGYNGYIGSYHHISLFTKKHKFFIKHNVMIIPELNEYIDIPDTINELRIWHIKDYNLLNNLPHTIEHLKISKMSYEINLNNLPINLKLLELYSVPNNYDLENNIKLPFGCEIYYEY